MSFDGLFFGLADYQNIAQRNATKTMEMIWKGSANLSVYKTNIKLHQIIYKVIHLRPSKLAFY
jgi:hypothetical protein